MFINSLQACRLLRHQASLGAQLSALLPTLMDSASRSTCSYGPLTCQGLDANAKLQYPHAVQHQFRGFRAHTSSISSMGFSAITSVKQCSSTPLRALSSLEEASVTAAQEACAPHHGHLHAFVEPLLDGYEGVSVLTLNRPLARNAIGKQVRGHHTDQTKMSKLFFAMTYMNLGVHAAWCVNGPTVVCTSMACHLGFTYFQGLVMLYLYYLYDNKYLSISCRLLDIRTSQTYH